MKTMLLCPELLARESGIQRMLRLYLKALCEIAGPDDRVDLVVLNDRELPAEKLARFSNDRLRLRVACGGSKAQFLWAAIQASPGVDRIVCGHLGQLIAARLARLFNPRLDYFLVAHGIEVWKPYSALERLALRRARRILCVSEFTRREMQRQIDLPEGRFAVVPNALDPFFAEEADQGVGVRRTEDLGSGPNPSGTGVPPVGLSSDTDVSPVGSESSPDLGVAAVPRGPDPSPEILSVARLDSREHYKGVDHLIEALPAVRQAVPGVRLRVVGSGDDLPRLMTLAEQCGMAEAVEFAGLVDDETLRDAYRDCAVFALPSHAEGFGIVFLEAMARGKPCLGALAGAIPGIIDPTSGARVDYGNIAQISARLVWMLHQPWDSAAIKARAAQFSYPAFKVRLQQALSVG